MRTAFLLMAVVALLLLPSRITGQGGCRLSGVDRETAKIGETVAANGESVGKKEVVELYLTDGTVDIKVTILEQSDTTIKFKVPDKTKPGRYSLMLKTGGSDPKLLEQPVKVEIVT